MTKKELKEFIHHSNLIEGVDSKVADKDALEAWEYLNQFDNLTSALICNAHYFLMQHLNRDIAGKFRTCDVWIGGKRKAFISTLLFREQLTDLCDRLEIKDSNDLSPEEIAKRCHVEFESIHPFEDGNGRIGRLIYNWQRLKLGLPLHIIHVGEEQHNYYLWFKQL